MRADFFYGVPRKPNAPRAGQTTRPSAPSGRATTGRVSSLQVGQGHGQIRLADGRAIFFHRADLSEGTLFNDLQVGDAVAFELLDDRVSGPRALRVRLRRR